MLPASLPGYPLVGGINPVHHRAQRLATGAVRYGDNGYGSGDDAEVALLGPDLSERARGCTLHGWRRRGLV